MENIWGLLLLTKNSFDVWRLYLFYKKKEKEQYASDLLLERAHKERRNEWYKSKPSLFILHNQLNIIIGPFNGGEIKDQ